LILSKKDLIEKIKVALAQQTPFVCYRKPNDSKITLVQQNDDTLNYLQSYSQTGFVFAPFNTNEKTILFELKNCNLTNYSNTIIEDSIIKKNDSFENTAIKEEKHTHEALVEKGITFIQKKATSKIVLSRKKTLKVKHFNSIQTFLNLLQTYKTAFVYIWFHPKIGLWFGATPETLLTINDKNFKTMALAGTQAYKNTLEVIWEEKEINEQQIVTNYIGTILSKLKITYKISKAHTTKAANLVHLKSDITGRINNKEEIATLIKALHPTPAVCGLPKETAKQFILENENYQREFYTGFLGELNFDIDKRQSKNNKRNIENHAYKFTKKQSNLFVNLRCMQVSKNNIAIYVGGGITQDSNPEKEYLETVAKAIVMERIIAN